MTTEVAFPHLPKIPKHTFFTETFLSRALPLQCFNTISRWTLSQVLVDLAEEAEISPCLSFLVWKNRANRISPKALLRDNQIKECIRTCTRPGSNPTNIFYYFLRCQNTSIVSCYQRAIPMKSSIPRNTRGCRLFEQSIWCMCVHRPAFSLSYVSGCPDFIIKESETIRELDQQPGTVFFCFFSSCCPLSGLCSAPGYTLTEPLTGD